MDNSLFALTSRARKFVAAKKDQAAGFEIASSEIAQTRMSSASRLCATFGKLLRCAALLSIVSATACQSAQPDRLDGAISNYESKNWKQSLEQASVVQNDSSGTLRDQAALLAGLSAYQLGNFSEAQTRFQISEQSMDAETAGESKVMLGDVMVHQKRYADAANYYDAAANKLTGEASNRAKDLAAASRDPARAGKVLSMAEPAISMNGNALSTSSSPVSTNSVTIASKAADASSGFEKDSSPPPVAKPKKPAKASDDKPAKPAKPAKVADDKPAKPSADTSAKTASKSAGKKVDSDAFVIQAGSFILETSAKNRAKEISKAASRNGIQAPKVVASKSKSGQKIWIVYVGEFETRADAEKAVRKLGRKDLVVVENPK